MTHMMRHRLAATLAGALTATLAAAGSMAASARRLQPAGRACKTAL